MFFDYHCHVGNAFRFIEITLLIIQMIWIAQVDILRIPIIQIMKKKTYFLSEKTKEKCQQRAEKRKGVISKKHQQKLLSSRSFDVCQQLQSLINTQSKEQIIKILVGMELTDLIAAAFSQNLLGQQMIVNAAQNKLDYFLKVIAQRIGPHRSLRQNFLKRQQNLCRKAYYSYLKLICRRVSKDSKDQFSEMLVSELIPLQGSLLSQIFQKYMEFSQIKSLIENYKNDVQIIGLMELLAKQLKMGQLSKLFNQYRKYSVGQRQGWQLLAPQESDLSIYVYPQISYNILHEFAKRKISQKFFKAAQYAENIHMFNQFNCSGQTPIDIALGTFSAREVQKLLSVISKNPVLHLSTNCLNKLLNNKNLYDFEDSILNFVKTSKSEDFRIQGYLQKIKISHGQFDIQELSEYSYILSKLDNQMDYPLLKYIRNSKKPRIDIVRELFFDDLKEETNRKSYDNLLICISYEMRRGNKKGYCRQCKNKNFPRSIQKYGNKFALYVKKLFQVALRKGDEDLLCYLVENAFSNIFMVDFPIGTNTYFPHLLRHLAEKNFLRAADLLLNKNKNIFQIQSTLSTEEQELERGTVQMIKRHQFNIFSHLVMNFSTLQIENTVTQKIKKILYQQYKKRPQLANSCILSNTLIFIVNRLGFLLTKQQWMNCYKTTINQLQLSSDNQIDCFLYEFVSTNQNLLQYILSDKLIDTQRFLQSYFRIIKSIDWIINVTQLAAKQKNQLFLSEYSNYALSIPFKKVKKMISKCIQNNKTEVIKMLIKNYAGHEQGRQYTACIIKELAEQVNPENLSKLEDIIHTIDPRQISLVQISITFNSSAVNRVKFLALLGFDTIVKGPYKGELKRKQDYYSRVVCRMIREQSTFSRVVFYNNAHTINEFIKFAKVKSLLYKFQTYLNQSQTQTNCMVSQSIVRGFYNWLLMKQTISILIQSDPSSQNRYLNLLKSIQKCQLKNIKKYAGEFEKLQYLAQFLTTSSVIKAISCIGQKMEQLKYLQSQLKEQKYCLSNNRKIEYISDSYQQSLMLLNDFYDIILANRNILTSKIQQLIPTKFYSYILIFNQIYYSSYFGRIIDFIKIIVPQLKSSEVIDILKQIISFSKDIILEKIIMSIAKNHPEIYLKALVLIKERRGKNQIGMLLYKTLKKMCWINDEIAYQQLMLCIQENLLQFEQYKEREQQQQLPNSQKNENEVEIEQYEEIEQEQQELPNSQNNQIGKQQQIQNQEKIQKIQQLNEKAKTYRYNYLLKLFTIKGHDESIFTIFFLLNDSKKYMTQLAQRIFYKTHFNDYVQKILQITKKYPIYYDNLKTFCLTLLKLQQWERLFYLLNKMVSQNINIVNISWQGFQLIGCKHKNLTFDKIVNVFYHSLTQSSPKTFQFLEEIPIYIFFTIVTFKPEALVTLKVQNLNLLDFIYLVNIVYKQKNSLKLHERLQSPPPTDFFQVRSILEPFFKITLKELRSEYIQSKSKSYYLILIKHIQFVRKYIGYEFMENNFIKYLKNLRRILLVRSQTDPQVQCIYQNTTTDNLSLSLVTSKQVTTIRSLLKIHPNLLNDCPQSTLFRKYLIKYANPFLLKDIIKQKILQPLDFQFIIACGDIQAAHLYLQQMGTDRFQGFFENQQYLFTLLMNGNERFCLELIQLFRLENKVWNFVYRGMNILFIISFLKKTKILNFLIRYWKENSLEDEISIKLQEVFESKSCLENAAELNFYEYLYLPCPLFAVPAFYSSSRYLNPSDFNKSLQDLVELPEYLSAILILNDFRNLLTNALKSPVNPNPINYSLEIHHFLLKVTFRTEQGKNPKELLDNQILRSLKYLTWGFQDKDFNQIMGPILVLVVLYDQSNKKMTEYIHSKMKTQAEIAKFLRNLIQPQNPIPISQFLVNVLQKQLSFRLSTFLFQNFKKQIVENMNVNHLLGNFSSSYLLLSQIVEQERIQVLSTLLAEMKSPTNTSNLFTMVLIITSNFPTLLPFILADFSVDSITDLFSEVAKDGELYFFAPTISKIEQLDSIEGFFKEYANKKQKTKEITDWMIKIKEIKWVSNEVIQGITKQVELWKEMKIVKVRLGMVMLQQLILTSLKRIQSQVQDFSFQVKMKIGKYEMFESKWVRATIGDNYEGKDHKLEIDSLVYIESKNLLRISFNIEQYFLSFSEAIRSRLYLVKNAALIKQQFLQYQNRISNNLPFKIPTMTVDYSSFQLVLDLCQKQKIFSSLLYQSDFLNMIADLKLFYDKSFTYNITDLSAPHRNDFTRIFPELYSMIQLPTSDRLMLIYSDKQHFSGLRLSGKTKIAQDIKQYCQVVEKLTAAQEIPSELGGTAQIYYTLSESGNLQMLTSYFSNWNIYYFGFLLQSLFQKPIKELKISLYFGVSYINFLNVFEELIINHSLGFFETMKLIINSPNLINFFNEVIFMIVTSAPNLMFIGKGVCVQFVKAKNGAGVVIFNSPECRLENVNYKIVSGVIVVQVGLSIKGSSSNPEVLHEQSKGNFQSLVKPKDFLECIFNTPQQLTNFFLDQNNLNKQLQKIAKDLTKAKGTMILLSFDFNSVYTVIKKLQKTKSFEQLKSILNRTSLLISQKLAQHLILEYQSRAMCDLSLLYLQILAESIQQSKGLPQIFVSNEISYPIDQQIPLSYVLNIYGSFECNNQITKDMVSNKFILQIYKSYFSTHFQEGNVYILKNKTSGNQIIKGDASTLQNIMMTNIDWVMWVTNTIPEEAQLDMSRVIRVFISDFGSNMYKINKKVQDKLIDKRPDRKELDISAINTVLPTNVSIVFDENELCKPKSLTDEFSKSSIRVIMNSKTLSPQLSSFNLPKFNLVQKIRLNSKVPDKIQKFKKRFKQIFQKPEGKKLTIRFEKEVETLHKEKKFDQIIQMICNQLEKMFEEFGRVDYRDEIVEQNVSALKQNIILNKNYLNTLRLDKFDKEFKQIRLEFHGEKGNSITFSSETMIIRVDIEILSESSISYGAMLQALIQELSTRTKPKQTVDFSFRSKIDVKRLNMVEKLRFLDILLLIDSQIQNCKISRYILQSLQKPTPCYLLNITSQGQSSIAYGETTILTLNVKMPKRLFTFGGIVAKALSLSEDTLTNGSKGFTEYIDNSIRIYNCQEKIQAVILISKQTDPTVKLQKEPPIKSITNNTITISSLFKSLKQNTSYLYLVLGDRTLLWNTISPALSLNQPPNSILSLGQPITFTFNILTNEYHPLSIDQLKLCYCINSLTFNILDGKSQKVEFNVTIPTRNLLSITLKLLKLQKIGVMHPSTKIYKFLNQPTSKCFVEAKSQGKLCIDNTEFLGLRFNQTTIQPINRFEHIYSDDFNEPPEKVKQPKQLVGQDLKKAITEARQKPLKISQIQSKHLTIAGKSRIDLIRFRDENFGLLNIQLKDAVVLFELSENPNIRLQPIVNKSDKDFVVQLIWQPNIKGRYRLNINNTILYPGYQIIVSSDESDSQKAILNFPKNISTDNMKLQYCQSFPFSIQHYDKYQNSVGGRQYLPVEEGFELAKLSSIKMNFRSKISKINELGQQTCQFSFLEQFCDSSNQSIVDIFIMKKLKKVIKVHLSGLTLKQKVKKLIMQIDLLKFDPNLRIEINRHNFIEELKKFGNMNLNRTLQIRFIGQPGQDAGGLLRQFFQLLGNEIKNPKLPFMKAILQTKSLFYMLNPALTKDPNNLLYMKIFGKFIANSVFNLSCKQNGLVGVQFALPFVKALYDEEIKFNDLKDILQESEFKQYQEILKYKADQFEVLQQDFTMQIDGKLVELCQNGKDKLVTADNVHEYLDCIAKQNIKIFQKEIRSFQEGFNSVLPLNLIKIWLQPEQFNILTRGQKQITPDVLLKVVEFSGGNKQLEKWFNIFIQQCSSKMLRQFLKFTTGSSCMPFDTGNYKISVQFDRHKSCEYLPISHTCFNTIEIPQYKSYNTFQTKLKAAFNFGSEGFDFG